MLVTLGDFFADNKQILVRIGDALDDDQAGFLEQAIDRRLAVLIGRAAGTQGFAESTVRLLNLLVNVSLVDAKIRQGIDVGKPTDDALAEIGAIVVALEQAGAMIREDPTKAGIEIVRQGAEFVASKLLTAFKAATGDTGAISEVAAFETEGALDLVGLGGAAGGSKKGLSLLQRLLGRLGRLGDDLAGTAERRVVTLSEQAAGGALSRDVVEEVAERQALRGSPVDEALSEAARVPRGRVRTARNIRPGNEPLPKEVEIANALADEGIDVLLRGSNVPGGDALINTGRRLRAEFKTLESANVRTFENNLRSASRQTGNFPAAVVLDARGVGVSPQDAASAIDRAIRNVAARRPNLREVLVLTEDGVIRRTVGQ